LRDIVNFFNAKLMPTSGRWFYLAFKQEIQTDVTGLSVMLSVVSWLADMVLMAN